MDRSQSVTIGDTYSINPTTVNSFHATWTRLAITRGPASDFINLTDVGVNMFSAAPNYMDISVNGYFGGGCGSCAPAILNQDSYQLANDLDMVRGRHHLSLGVDLIHYQFNYRNYVIANGSVTLTAGPPATRWLISCLGCPAFLSKETCSRSMAGRIILARTSTIISGLINGSMCSLAALGTFPARAGKIQPDGTFRCGRIRRGYTDKSVCKRSAGTVFPGRSRGYRVPPPFPRYPIFEPRVGPGLGPDRQWTPDHSRRLWPFL